MCERVEFGFCFMLLLLFAVSFFFFVNVGLHYFVCSYSSFKNLTQLI
jgi:hypothetical protein